MSKIKKVTLGSGKLYIQLFDGSVPELETIVNDEHLLGYIQGGATVEYKPTFYNVKDDLGYVEETILTEEEATLKSGLMTWNGETLAKLSDTARVSTDPEKNLRIVKIGGLGNMKKEKYVIVFHHEDKVEGDIWVVIVGQNQAGFTLAFAKDKETVIDAEFKCMVQDNEGTLIKYIEEDKSISTLQMNKINLDSTGAK